MKIAFFIIIQHIAFEQKIKQVPCNFLKEKPPIKIAVQCFQTSYRLITCKHRNRNIKLLYWLARPRVTSTVFV